MLLEGLNRIRDLHGTDIVKGQLGTDGSATSESQTGLQTPVAATELSVTVTPSDKANQVNYFLDKDTATPNTFREFGTNNDAGVDYDRSVFPGSSHNGNSSTTVLKTFFYRQA